MGLFPHKLEPDMCMQQIRDICKYIYVYVDDLEIGIRDLKILMDALENRYKFKIKGMGPIEFKSGCNLFHHSNCVLWFLLHKYTGKMVQTYVNIFGSNPRQNKDVRDHLKQGYYQELDTLGVLDN